MKWEELKVYKPLTKEELKVAKKEIEKIISVNLGLYGFKKYGRKLIRIADDIFHIIHLDMRGSWMGASNDLKTEIALVSIYDTDVFIDGFELTASRKIENIVPKIRNYYQITKEYELFADFISRNLVEYVLPYFDRHKNSKEILSKTNNFKIDNVSEIIERNGNLILYCELANHKNDKSIEILEQKIEFLKQLNNQPENCKYFETILNCIKKSEWKNVDEMLNRNKEQVFRRLNMMPAPNDLRTAYHTPA